MGPLKQTTVIAELPKGWQYGFMLNFIHNIRLFLVGSLLTLSALTSAISADRREITCKQLDLHSQIQTTGRVLQHGLRKDIKHLIGGRCGAIA
jgi:hypothetical protein